MVNAVLWPPSIIMPFYIFLKHLSISYCIKNPVLEPEWTLRVSLKEFLTEKTMGLEKCVQITDL